MTEDHEHDEDPEAAVSPADAHAAEAEEQDAEDAHEAEQAAHEAVDPSEQEAATQEVWEARFKYAERIAKPYYTKIEKEWAEDAQYLVRFNLDDGAPAGYIDTRNMGRASDETKEAALAFLGANTGRNLRPDPFSDQCPICGGAGDVDTRSFVPGHDSRMCPECGGKGYVLHAGAPSPAELSNPPFGTDDNGVMIPQATGPEDPLVEQLRLRGYIVTPPMQGVS